MTYHPTFSKPMENTIILHKDLTPIYSPRTSAHRRVWFFCLVLTGKKDEVDGRIYYSEPRHIVYANRTWFAYYTEHGYIEVPNDFNLGYVKNEE